MLEDDPVLGNSIEKSLKDSEFIVTWCKSLSEAQHELEQHRFHITVIDLHVPNEPDEPPPDNILYGRRLIRVIEEYSWNTTILRVVYSDRPEVRELIHQRYKVDRIEMDPVHGVLIDDILYLSKTDLPAASLGQRLREHIKHWNAKVQYSTFPKNHLLNLSAAANQAKIDNMAQQLKDDLYYRRSVYGTNSNKHKYLESLDPDHLTERLQEEVEDIIRQLFPVEEGTSLRFTVINQGKSGAIVAKVSLTPPVEIPTIIKIGLTSSRKNEDGEEAEDEAYEESVKGKIQRHAMILHIARTPLLKGIRYSIAGREKGAEVTTFRSAYNAPKTYTNDFLGMILHDLFQINCPIWYKSSHSVPLHETIVAEFMQSVKCTPPKIEKALKKIDEWLTNKKRRPLQSSGSTLYFDDLNPMHDPLKIFLQSRRDGNGKDWWVPPIYLGALIENAAYCTIHGDMNDTNIIIGERTADDEQPRTWLIDFARTGKGYFYRDFVELECVIKFQLLRSVTLNQRHELELAVQAQELFADLMPSTNLSPSLAADERCVRAYETVCAIRHNAWISHGDKSESPFDEQRHFVKSYNFFLLLQTMNQIRYLNDEDENSYEGAVGAYLSAAMLSEKLGFHP
jgi:hypothetical protein